MRYFEVTFPSKKTAHPDGEKNIVVYQEGMHKKMACENALGQLEILEGDNMHFFKLPKVTRELTLDEYEEITAPAIEETTAAEGEGFTPFTNEDDDLGLTVAELNKAVACAALFTYDYTDGGYSIYSDNELCEVKSFIDNPIEHGTTEELADYTRMHQTLAPFMSNIFTQVDAKDMLKIACETETSIYSTMNPAQHMIRFMEGMGLTPVLNEPELEVEPEPEIESAPGLQNDADIEPEPEVQIKPEQEAPEPEIEAPAFVIPAFKPRCTFASDLKALNAKLDALPVGGSLIINGLSNALYHASDSYSKSSLDIINSDPSLIEWSKNAPRNPDKEQTFVFGSAFHTMVLEPHLFDDECLVMPELNLRTNEGKAKKIELLEDAKAKNKNIISKEEKEQLDLMKGSVMAHPTAKKLLANGIAEQSIFYRLSENLVVRIRPDWLTELNGEHFIVDLKSCIDAKKFEWSIGDYRYHVQDAFYSYIYELATGQKTHFAFIATGKAICMGKYPTRVCVLDVNDKIDGLADAQENLDTLQESLNTNIWGGFESVSMPARYRRKF